MSNSELRNAIIEVLDKVLESDEGTAFGGDIGSGGHARKFTLESERYHTERRNHQESAYKVVIPGDSKYTVIQQLQYLFGDLAVDLGLSEEIRNKIYGRIG